MERLVGLRLSLGLLFSLFLSSCLAASVQDDKNTIQSLSGRNMVAQFLAPQNQMRAKVGDPPLRWIQTLAHYAQWWENQSRWDCSLTHSNGPYGENIFLGSGKDWQPKDAVSAWIGEYRWYNYNRNSCNGYQQCGHYTQIVWRKSRSVGCARVVCYNGDVFMTCNYFPPGNYLGQKPYWF